MKSIIVLSTLLLFSCGGKTSGELGTPPSSKAKSGNPAPNFNLKSVDGKDVTLENFRGKVVLLDFWATWCGPCRMSMPILKRLHEKMKGKDFVILSISVDEDHDPVLPYIKRENVKHLVLYADDAVQMNYRIRAIPTFYILDKKGFISKKYEGFDPSFESVWESEINSLLK